MKIIKKGKGYINYGLIPKNEYAVVNSGKDTVSAVLEIDSKPDEVAYNQRLSNQQALHPSGRRNIRGWTRWTRSWKVNGWRAEAAMQDDELTGMRYFDYIRKPPRSL